MRSTIRVKASNTSWPAPKRAANCSESRVHLRWMSSDNSITGPIDVDASWISHARLSSHRIAKGARDRIAPRQQPVIAQNHRRLVADGTIRPRPFVRVHRDALEVVIRELAVQLRRIEIAHRQAFVAAGHRHARSRVRVHHAVGVRHAVVNRRMDGEAGRVHRPDGDSPRMRPCEVDLHEVRRASLRCSAARTD